MQRLTLTATVLVTSLLVAGCGSGGKHYDTSAVQGCLSANGMHVGTDTGVQPFAGSQGDLDIDTGNADIFVEFGKDSREANYLANGVRAAGRELGGADVSDAVATRGNVMYYTNDATIDSRVRSILESCLANQTSAATTKNPTSPVASKPTTKLYPYQPSAVDAFEQAFNNSMEARGYSPQYADAAGHCLIGYGQLHWSQADFIIHGRAMDQAWQDAMQTCESASGRNKVSSETVRLTTVIVPRKGSITQCGSFRIPDTNTEVVDLKGVNSEDCAGNRAIATDAETQTQLTDQPTVDGFACKPVGNGGSVVCTLGTMRVEWSVRGD